MMAFWLTANSNQVAERLPHKHLENEVEYEGKSSVNRKHISRLTAKHTFRDGLEKLV